MFFNVFIKLKKHVFMFFYLQINVFNIYGRNINSSLTYKLDTTKRMMSYLAIGNSLFSQSTTRPLYCHSDARIEEGNSRFNMKIYRSCFNKQHPTNSEKIEVKTKYYAIT